MALNGTERIWLQTNYQNFQSTVSAVAGHGAGGYLFEEDISSGTVNLTANVATIVLWGASDAAPKTNFIPTASGSKQIITLVDVEGNAYTYPITAVPLSGSIIGPPAQVYTNYGSLTLYDSSTGWVQI